MVLQLLLGLASLGLQASALSDQRESTRLQRQQQQVSARRERRQMIRQGQQQAAAARAMAAGTGTLQSSGFFGGQSSLTSQIGTNLGFATQMSGLSQQINTLSDRAQFKSGLSSLAMTAYDLNRNRTPGVPNILPEGY